MVPRLLRRLVLTLTPFLLIASCSKSPEPSAAQAGKAVAGPGARGGGPPAPQVGVVTVAQASVPESYEFVGQVEPFRRVEVRSRVEGIVVDRPFTEGSFVEKGQILYKLDQVKYEAAYRSALARYDNAKRTVARLEPLLPKHAVAQQDVDNAQSELESSQAALDEAKKDLDDTVIRAEIAGQIGRARLELGARVTGPADLLTTIDELDPVYVTFHPSSQQLLAWAQDPQARGLVQAGSSLAVRVVMPDGTLLSRVGRINFMAPSLDSTSGTEEVRSKFDNADHRLVPGQFVRVRLDGFRRSDALAIPQRAVQQGLGRQFVYVVGAGDSVVARDVKTGPWSGPLWIIDDGLKPGDRVVVDGVQKVAPGRIVTPVPVIDSASVVQAQAGTPSTAPGAPKRGGK